VDSATVIAIVAVLAGAACSLAGVFLVLRRMAMMADAISHSILPGLVAAYVLARGPSLLWGFAGATAAGMATVVAVEAMVRTRRLREDAAIGLAFTAMFALGVFIVSRHFAHVHLDTDAVLFGEIAFTPFDTLQIAGRDYGPLAIWTLGALTVLNAGFLVLFYKELKVATFDPVLAGSLGLKPGLVHYLLMGVVALTTVGAFGVVGAILAVALIVVPPATASLLTKRLPWTIALSVFVGAFGGLLGYRLASVWDVSISGMMAVALGGFFLLAFLFSPSQGVLAQIVRKRSVRARFAVEMLVVHLQTHEHTPEEAEESRVAHLERELGWSPKQVGRIVQQAERSGIAVRAGERMVLTEQGRKLAVQVRSRGREPS
jgi:manganese/zinc/iron transport system permease protein